MKKFLTGLVCLLLLSFTIPTNAQEEKTSQVVYNGFDGKSYNFTTVTTSPQDAKTISFPEIGDAILAEYDLKSEAFKGETFTATYLVNVESEEAPDGTNVSVEKFKLVGLKE